MDKVIDEFEKYIVEKEGLDINDPWTYNRVGEILFEIGIKHFFDHQMWKPNTDYIEPTKEQLQEFYKTNKLWVK